MDSSRKSSVSPMTERSALMLRSVPADETVPGFQRVARTGRQHRQPPQVDSDVTAEAIYARRCQDRIGKGLQPG